MVFNITVIKMDEIGSIGVVSSNFTSIEMTVMFPVHKDSCPLFKRSWQFYFRRWRRRFFNHLTEHAHLLEGGDDGFGDGSWVVVNGRVVDHVPAYD